MAGVFPPPQRSVIKSVQRGLAQFDEGVRSKTVTISAVNPSKTVTSVGFRGGYDASGITVGIGGHLSGATTLVVELFGASNPVIPFSWEVVEYE